jgi:hypothetical protein
MTKKHYDSDYELQTLLELNGFVFYTKNGYWVKFEACKVKPTKNILHGINVLLLCTIKATEELLDMIMLTIVCQNAASIKQKNLNGITFIN